MTAVVGILNKKGVAVAADSAVTVASTYNRKVYNSANKIFTISKYHPIGVALYSGADFMGIPWEVIIKEYREWIGNRSFETVAEYRDDFIKWMKEERDLFRSDRFERAILKDFYQILNDVINRVRQQESLNKDNLIATFEDVGNKLQQYEVLLEDSPALLENLLSYREEVKEEIEKYTTIILTEDETDILLGVYLQYLLRDQFLNYTGLVFVGYGNKELFPRVLPINISIAFGDQLRMVKDRQNEAVISIASSAAVMPFAQKDVIQTILQGVSPDILAATKEVFNSFISHIINESQQVPNLPLDIRNALANFTPEQMEQFSRPFMVKLYEEINRSHNKPMLDTVSHLDKEDLAEMAESLIYLTYLKRRFTMVEESVGGPVDVAVITKGDGFIWIKRKHYFEPTLNKHFFQKYYKQ